jgi:hypothetical protein
MASKKAKTHRQANADKMPRNYMQNLKPAKPKRSKKS